MKTYGRVSASAIEPKDDLHCEVCGELSGNSGTVLRGIVGYPGSEAINIAPDLRRVVAARRRRQVVAARLQRTIAEEA
jgi:hypothetical protein